MPMLALPDVPAIYAARQIKYLLDCSEVVFPKLKALGAVPNMLLAIVCFIKRNGSNVAKVKWPCLAAAFICNIGVTIWSAMIMVPINGELKSCAKALEGSRNDKGSKRQLRILQ